MSDKPTVVEALSKVMSEVQAVRKDSTNDQQHYRFRGIDAVVNAVGPAFRQHGVVCLPSVEHVEYAVVEVGQRRTPMRECTVRVRYTFYGPGGDSLECVAIGEAMDSGDKATPKAMSVAYRVALLQALCIPTDEPDADAQSYERVAPLRRSEAKLQAIQFALESAQDEIHLRKAWEQVPAAVESGQLTDDDAQMLADLVKRRRAEFAPLPHSAEAPSERATRRMHATFRELGITDPDAKYSLMSDVTGRRIASSKELSAADVDAVIVRLDEMKARRRAAGDGSA